MIALIVILGICCFCSICLLSTSGGLYYEYSRNGRSYIIPSSFYFQSKPGYKYIGHQIKTLNETSKNNCMGECLESPHCVGITYYDDKKCDIQAQSYKTDNDFSTPWNGATSFARNDPKKRIELKKGKVQTSSYISEEHKVNSLNECVEKCIGAKDGCISANYYNSGLCQFMTNLKEENLKNNSNGIFFYKKGIPGGNCLKPSDCVYGLCEDNLCLNRNPIESGRRCKSDRECISGYCDTINRSYSEQNEELQDLLTKADPDAKFCDKYKNAMECVASPIQRSGETISGALCDWRSPNKIAKFENIDCETNAQCPNGLECVRGKCKCTEVSCSNGYCVKDTCFVTGDEGKCFTRDIETYYKACR